MEHTKEPWSYKRTHGASNDYWYVILDRNMRGPIFEIGGKDETGQIGEAKHLITDQSEIEANARRIVACVNACAGISTEVLEGAEQITSIKSALNGYLEMKHQRDELLAALKNLVHDCERAGHEKWSTVRGCNAIIAQVEA